MNGKYAKKKKSSRKGFWTILIMVLVLLGGFAVLGILAENSEEPMPLPTEPGATDGTSATDGPTATTEPSVPYTFEEEVEGVTSFSLDRGLEILRYGRYVGLYMEDGSDDFVTDVMMIVVKNNSDKAIQYAKISLNGPAGEAVFTLTTLMPGDSVVVLEAGRKPYLDTDVYNQAVLQNVAYFAEEPSRLEDQLLIQPLEGGFNITNISGQDITGRISVYFKDVAGGMYYGGITYVCNIEGGMKADEVRQIMSSNFTESGSQVVFVRIVP